MDRQLDNKRVPTKSILMVLAGLVIFGLLIKLLLSNASATAQLRVDPERITIATVAYGEFKEYYPFDGIVEPVVSVFLDVEEGGRVEEIFFDGGQLVHKGDLIMRISNAALQRSSIDTETRLLENLDRLSNTQFNRAQSQITLREQSLDIDFKIEELTKKHARYASLMQRSDVVSQEQFETVQDELVYLQQRRELLRERMRQENLLSKQQLEQTTLSQQRLSLSLDMLSRIVDSLDVKAPISGYLSSIDASLGESIGRGQRIGQIDVLDSFKLRVEVDQYYISNITLATKGQVTLGGGVQTALVKKIYPEVVNNVFAVDMEFVGEQPKQLRRGQTLTVELSFSETQESLRVNKGSFYQQTGGRWVYLIAEDGLSARRVSIRLGRQNPRFVEVLDGLRNGDRIITSGYAAFNEVDKLVFEARI